MRARGSSMDAERSSSSAGSPSYAPLATPKSGSSAAPSVEDAACPRFHVDMKKAKSVPSDPSGHSRADATRNG